MDKWADFVISQVSYDSNHLISKAKRHKDSEKGIDEGKFVDRLTIASDIKNGFDHITIYSGLSSWKRGHKIHVFRINGQPFIRIDENKVKFDNLGDLPEITSSELEQIPEPIEEDEATPEQLARLEQLERQIRELESKPTTLSSPRGSLPKESADELPQELDLAPEPIEEDEATPEQLARLEQLERQIRELESKPTTLSSPRGSLPKESADELPQELDLAPEPIEEDEATPEQLQKLADLQNQIDDLEKVLHDAQIQTESKTISKIEEDEATPEQLQKLADLQNQIDDLEKVLHDAQNSNFIIANTKFNELEKEIGKIEAIDIEHEIIQTLRKQNQKLDDIENKLYKVDLEKPIESISPIIAYCVKCKRKQSINQPQETTMKNGRSAIKGKCSVCNCNVFRIGKIKINQ